MDEEFVTLVCECCLISRSFADLEEAFRAGWDAPPHFSTHVCCDLCPAVCVVLRLPHEKAHAHWQAHGRPAEFSVVLCGDDATFGSETAEAMLAAMVKKAFGVTEH